MIPTIKIATRSSLLALWQAEHIQDLLLQNGLKSELITFETKGDKILDRSLSKIGSKGLFTEELEQSLLQGEAHIAVHSAKDLPSSLPEELEIIAFTEREAFHDVLVSEKEIDIDSKFRVGSSSTRRIALLKRYFPNIEAVPMRGNLQTRIKKMQDGDCDALMLAYAGVFRMGYGSMIKHSFDKKTIVPPVGQGALALEASVHLDPEIRAKIRDICNHKTSEDCLKAERSFLKIMEGGCSVPIFALASIKGEELQLQGGIVSLDGKDELKDSETRTIENSSSTGEILAKRILGNGGKEILTKIKEQL